MSDTAPPSAAASLVNWRTPFVIALVLRVLFVLFYPQQSVHADAANYDQLGWSLAQGLGYRLPGGEADVYWSPGYPAALAALYAVVGHDYVVVRLMQAVVSALLVVVVALAAATVFGRRTGFVAAMLCACYPGFIGYTGLLLTETLFASLVAVSVYGLLRITPASATRSVVGLGVLIGLTCLVRAEVVLLPLVVLGVLRLLMKDQTISLRQGLIMYAAVVLTVAPWSTRNYLVTGEFIPLTVHDADVLWISSFPEEWLELDTSREPYQSMVAGLSQVESAKVLRAAGIRNIVEHPGTFLWLSIKRVPRLWIGGHSNVFVGMQDSLQAYFARQEYVVFTLKAAMLGVNSLLVLLGGYGLYVASTRVAAAPRSVVILIAPVVFVTAVHFVLFSTSRFQIPVMPYVLIFCAVAIGYLRRSRRVMPGTA